MGCALLSYSFEIFNAYINVKACNSVESTKYTYKYANNGNDVAVFRLVIPNAPVYEVKHFKMRCYISSNKAVGKILGFNIHKCFPAVMHLSVKTVNESTS